MMKTRRPSCFRISDWEECLDDQASRRLRIRAESEQDVSCEFTCHDSGRCASRDIRRECCMTCDDKNHSIPPAILSRICNDQTPLCGRSHSLLRGRFRTFRASLDLAFKSLAQETVECRIGIRQLSRGMRHSVRSLNYLRDGII